MTAVRDPSDYKILCVDDEPNILSALKRMIRNAWTIIIDQNFKRFGRARFNIQGTQAQRKAHIALLGREGARIVDEIGDDLAEP